MSEEAATLIDAFDDAVVLTAMTDVMDRAEFKAAHDKWSVSRAALLGYISRIKRERDGYYNEAADGWVKFRAAERALAERDARIAELEEAARVPGMMRCAKCEFVLTRTNLYVNQGTTGPGSSETEPCPNGCGPLWPMTWRDYASGMDKTVMRYLDERDEARAALEAENATLRAAFQVAEDQSEHDTALVKELEAEVERLRADARGLTFSEFRAANVARCVKWHPAGIESWSASDWLTAVTGELGELASLIKMRNRERDGLVGNKFSPTDDQISDEIADVVTYIDLLGAFFGIDLGHAVARKFNAISERNGFTDRLPMRADTNDAARGE